MENKKQESPVVAITGANGFVGSHLVELLLSKGYKVKAILRSSSHTRWLDEEKLEIVRCGLGDPQKLAKAFEGVEYIFHIAGVVSAKKKEGYFQGNVDLTRNVLEGALKNKSLKKIVVTSSLAAAGSTTPGNPLDESHEGSLVSHYGRSKKAQEELTRQYMDKLPITIIRPPAVYGERDTEVLLFFKTIQKGFFTQIGLKPKTLSLIHVKDLVNGIYKAGVVEASKGETYFLGSVEPEYSWQLIGEMSAKILEKKPFNIKIPHWIIYIVAAIAQAIAIFQKKSPTLNLDKASVITQSSWSCTSEKAIKELGYGEAKGLEERLRQTLEWYKKEGWL